MLIIIGCVCENVGLYMTWEKPFGLHGLGNYRAFLVIIISVAHSSTQWETLWALEIYSMAVHTTGISNIPCTHIYGNEGGGCTIDATTRTHGNCILSVLEWLWAIGKLHREYIFGLRRDELLQFTVSHLEYGRNGLFDGPLYWNWLKPADAGAVH